MPIIRPVNLQKPFADAGAKNTIPVASQIGIDSGAASYTDGFPPLTRTPIAAGGIPPKGTDMNGILYEVSAHTVFQNAGGQYRFDAALAAEIGGYPIGTKLQSNDGLATYLSIVDANTDDFNTSPASIGVSWLLIAMPKSTTTENQALTNDDHSMTPKGLADAFKGGNQSLGGEGYQSMPGGLLVQWGITAPIPAVTNTAVVFPISFLNVRQMFITYNNMGGNAGTQVSGQVRDMAASGANIRNLSSESVQFSWLAIGNL